MTTPQQKMLSVKPVEAGTMKIPRVRFTVRRMMAAVAVIALALGAARYWALRQYYLQKAANHAGFRAYLLNSQESIMHWENRWKDQRSVNRMPAKYPWPAEPPYMPAIAKYHDDMRLKYERAARYPWLPVEPDSPDR